MWLNLNIDSVNKVCQLRVFFSSSVVLSEQLYKFLLFTTYFIIVLVDLGPRPNLDKGRGLGVYIEAQRNNILVFILIALETHHWSSITVCLVYIY